MIENYSISQNEAGSLLVTLVLGLDIRDLQPKITRDERFVRVDCVLHRTYAKEQIEAIGYHVEEEDKYTLSFMYHCHTIRFFPYTGAIVGHGIEQGLRGLKTLLEIIKEK